MTPTRKRTGQLACGCVPYHQVGDPADHRLCREAKRLSKAVLPTEPWTEEGKEARAAYDQHVGFDADAAVKPEAVAT